MVVRVSPSNGSVASMTTGLSSSEPPEGMTWMRFSPTGTVRYGVFIPKGTLPKTRAPLTTTSMGGASGEPCRIRSWAVVGMAASRAGTTVNVPASRLPTAKAEELVPASRLSGGRVTTASGLPVARTSSS